MHAVDGEGYSLLWYEGDEAFKELPWRHGIMYTPPFWMFHQHFNTGPKPARYLACSLGSRRYPFIALRRRSAEGGGMVSIQQGGRQIEYEDQDPRIHRQWLEAIRETGVASDMGDMFDEAAILRAAAVRADRADQYAGEHRAGGLVPALFNPRASQPAGSLCLGYTGESISMSKSLILVRAQWDAEAGVWVAMSEDVPGLVTEADTLEALRDKLLIVIPELLEANNITFGWPEIPTHIMAEQTARAM